MRPAKPATKSVRTHGCWTKYPFLQEIFNKSELLQNWNVDLTDKPVKKSKMSSILGDSWWPQNFWQAFKECYLIANEQSWVLIKSIQLRKVILWLGSSAMPESSGLRPFWGEVLGTVLASLWHRWWAYKTRQQPRQKQAFSGCIILAWHMVHTA